GLGRGAGGGGGVAGRAAGGRGGGGGARAPGGRSAAGVAGGVGGGRAVAASGGWPVRAGRGGRAGAAAARGEGPPAQAATPRPPAPQVVTRWVALGYPATGEDPAVLAVAAALLAEELGQSGLGGASAELWWNAGRRALVLLAPEPPGRNGDGDGSVRQRLERAVAAVAEGVDAAAVARARRRAV